MLTLTVELDIRHITSTVDIGNLREEYLRQSGHAVLVRGVDVKDVITLDYNTNHQFKV